MRSSLTSPPNLLLSSRPGVCVCIQKQAPHFPQFFIFSLKFFSVPFIHPSFFFLLLQPLFSYYKCHSIKSSLRYPSLTPSIPHPSARNKTKQNKKYCIVSVSAEWAEGDTGSQGVKTEVKGFGLIPWVRCMSPLRHSSSTVRAPTQWCQTLHAMDAVREWWVWLWSEK